MAEIAKQPVASILSFHQTTLERTPSITHDELLKRFEANVGSRPKLELSDGTTCTIGLSAKSCLSAPGDGVHLIVSNPLTKEGKELTVLTESQNCDVLHKLLAQVDDALGLSRRDVTFGINFGSLRNRADWHAHLAIYLKQDALVADQWTYPSGSSAQHLEVETLSDVRTPSPEANKYYFMDMKQLARESTAEFIDRAFESTSKLGARLNDRAGYSVRIHIDPERAQGKAFLPYILDNDQTKPPRLVDQPSSTRELREGELRQGISRDLGDSIYREYDRILIERGKSEGPITRANFTLIEGGSYQLENDVRTGQIKCIYLYDHTVSFILHSDSSKNSLANIRQADSLLCGLE